MHSRPVAPRRIRDTVGSAMAIFLPGWCVVVGCPFVPKRESFRVDNMRVSGETPLEWCNGGERSCFFSGQFKGFGGETAVEPLECQPLHVSTTDRADRFFRTALNPRQTAST